MKQKGQFVVAAVGLMILGCAGLMILKRQSSRTHEVPRVQAGEVGEKASLDLKTAPSEAGHVESITNEPASADATNGIEISGEAKKQTADQAKKKGGPKKKVVQDPLAREALALVGADPSAEEYWFAALNDPTLPKSERQDLVDDLNEEGLPDPKHPTMEDLPVLLARIELLEQAALWFHGEDYDWKEPYEDLVNLVDVALGGGKPVQ